VESHVSQRTQDLGHAFRGVGRGSGPRLSVRQVDLNGSVILSGVGGREASANAVEGSFAREAGHPAGVRHAAPKEYNESEVINQFMATTPNSVPKVVSALAARTQFGQIMRRARTENARFIVDKRGEPQVVIMSIRDFIKTIAPENKVMAAVRATARKKGTNRLTLRDINRVIRAARRERSL
jgi:prevent-host-death family protein